MMEHLKILLDEKFLGKLMVQEEPEQKKKSKQKLMNGEKNTDE
jgi:hypothetical protein